MGGRGTFAVGNIVPYQYKTVDKIEGVKVLEPIDSTKSFNLPAESHSSSSYIGLDKNGVFHQYREYNSNHDIVFEIDYHYEQGLSKNGEHVFHVHDYLKPGIDNRGKAREMTQSEYEKYKKFFRGVEK
jgi:hypothetical protein